MPLPPATPISDVVRAAIDLGRFPWIRPLVNAYGRDFGSVASLFAGNPADPAAWRDTIGRVQRAPRNRPALTDALERQLAARGAPIEARTAAAKLRDATSVAVVTGQQAGLFGGPLYTLLKAITAMQLARTVEAEYGTPAVPVFWVDEEDHDWDEIRSAQILDRDLALQELTLDPVEGAGTWPVSRLRLDARADATLDRLEQLLAPTEFTAETMAMLRRRYRAGEGVARAFAGLIDDLLGALGLVVFESGDPSVKPLAADLFGRELANPCRTARLAREAGAAMAALGHDPQVDPAEDSVALFYLDDTGRHPIRRREGGFGIGSTERPSADLVAEAAAHPERFSPNVLLRPLVQDRLFPTVCYVAGPSELAYQAQLGGIYQCFGVEAPLLYSRATATLLDSAAIRFLDRHTLPVEALHAQDESALNRLLESQIPPDVERAIEDTERQMAERAAAIKASIVSIDPTLTGAVDTTVERMRDTLKSLHGKIIHAAKRKDETLRRQFNRTRALTFPGGQPQERTLTAVFFINRYGPGLGARLIETVPLDTNHHYLLVP